MGLCVIHPKRLDRKFRSVLLILSKERGIHFSGLVAAMFSVGESPHRPSDPSSFHSIPKTIFLRPRAVSLAHNWTAKYKNFQVLWFQSGIQKNFISIFLLEQRWINCGSQTSLYEKRNSGRWYMTSCEFRQRKKVSINTTVHAKKDQKRHSPCRVRKTFIPDEWHHVFRYPETAFICDAIKFLLLENLFPLPLFQFQKQIQMIRRLLIGMNVWMNWTLLSGTSTSRIQYVRRSRNEATAFHFFLTLFLVQKHSNDPNNHYPWTFWFCIFLLLIRTDIAYKSWRCCVWLSGMTEKRKRL